MRPRSETGLTFVVLCLAALLAGASAPVYAQPATSGAPDAALIEDLVAANRILVNEGVLDGWGHVSVRHNRDPNRYLMARGSAPELVSAADILEFDLDSRPVDAKGFELYSERYIHGEIYKARPDVMAVVHTHAPPLIPFGVTGIALRPVYHRSAWIAAGVPLFEIRDTGGATDLLVRNALLGRALAKTLDRHPAALMRGHGAVVTGPNLRRVVTRSIFLSINATLQMQAMALGAPVQYLSAEEAALIEKREDEARAGGGAGRAWEAWKKKALGAR